MFQSQIITLTEEDGMFVMVEDNIPATATSTGYTPGDELPHDYVVRAVNQCGVAKDYVAATHGPGLFFDDFETGTTNAWSNVVP